jgi:hypothetical protein
MVRNYPHGRRLLRQTKGWFARRSKAFRPAFTDQGPCLPGAHAPRLRRAHARGRRGRPSHPLIHLPLTGGHRFSKGPRHPFPRHPTGGAPISLSLSLSLSLFMRPCGPIRGLARCPPWGIRREISAPCVTMVIPETLHNIMSQ